MNVTEIYIIKIWPKILIWQFQFRKLIYLELRQSIGSLEIWLRLLENSTAWPRSISKMLEKKIFWLLLGWKMIENVMLEISRIKTQCSSGRSKFFYARNAWQSSAPDRSDQKFKIKTCPRDRLARKIQCVECSGSMFLPLVLNSNLILCMMLLDCNKHHF